MRIGKLSVLSVIVLLSVLVLLSGQNAHAINSNATVTTDQSDYLAGSTVTIYGSGFTANVPITVSVTDPNSNTTAWSVTSDSSGGFTTTYILDHVSGNYLVSATDGVNSASVTFHDSSEAANLDQCTNGGVGATPEPCDVGTVGSTNLFPGGTFSNWVNGNSNGAKSHWQEGDGIPYRVTITGLTAGTHTLAFSWDVVHGGTHAIDYIESVDATESFSATSTAFHFNNNDPCQDKIACTPASPISTTPIAGPTPLPAWSPANGCGGAGGTFTGAQNPGHIDAWGAGVTLTSLVYTSQNVLSGTGQCSSSGLLTFTTASGTTEVVVAWAGHIASQADWGAGNSASFIPGSPFHMSLDTLDGASTGSQDRALAATAIFFTPTISTVVINDSTGLAAVSPLSLGTSVHDTATLSGAGAPTGTVAYKFYTNGVCSGTPSTTQTVTLSGGLIPNSVSTGPLGAGSYSYNATYSGDSTNFPKLPNSACEPFTVAKAATTISTTVVFKNGTPITSPIPLGSIVNDTATISGQVVSIPATGTVTYQFYTTNTCTGTFTSQTVTVAGGLVPHSSQHGPLAAGLYSFNATYSGDSNYTGSTSACEPFQVGKTPSSTSTAIHIAPSGTTDVTGTTQPLGTSVFDTATVTGSPFTPTGTVTYFFFMNGFCSGTASSTQTVTLAGGAVPNSSPTGALQAGSYSYQAVYSGDANYNGSTSSCETITIAKANTSTATVVFDASTNSAWSGTESTGASAYDTATVTASPFTPTGTVTYTFYTNGGCTGSGTLAGTVTLTGTGSVPNSNTEGPPLAAGSYSFQATYSGDSNYNGSISSCEPFTVNKGTSSTATVVFDAATNAPWTGTETTGASAYDTSTVTTSDTIVATGTVVYTFYSGSTCSGTGTALPTVTLTGSGSVPKSATVGPLQAGSYSFRAVYSGDSNYSGSTSPCEPFTVNKGTSTTATVVFDASTNAPWSGTETTGASAYDTATVTSSDGFTATGTVSYTFFTNGGCSGTGVSAGTVTLTGSGAVPNSNTEGPPLAAGSYSFQATYSGDSNYSGSTGGCEPFNVTMGTSSTATVVFDASTSAPWTGSETTGASAYDTSTVSTSDTIVATGTVTYTFYMNGGCSGTGVSQTVSLTGTGSVPNSATHGPLMAGSYSFKAVYSGDSNYSGSTSSCEPFTVGPGSSSTATVVFDASTNAPWSGTETTGASAYDTATVTTSDGFVATGTVSYTFYTNGACSGTGSSAGTVTLTGTGSVPNSNTEGPPLATGSYSFKAVYSGDSNYNGSTSACEPFGIARGNSTVATTVFDAATSAPWTGSETTGASAYDTSTVTTSDTIVATGTVTYTFYTNGVCSGTGVSQTVTLTGTGSVPNSGVQGPLTAGSYSFQAVYSGDTNYSGSTSPCEPFTVNKGTSNTSTVVYDATTNAPWSGTETTGASAYDTASVTTSDGFVATGTVSYTFFSNGSCSATGTTAGTVTLTATGSVPNSNTEGPPLAAGSYSFQATYSGDSNYSGSTSTCEPFSVSKGSSSTTTAVFDAATNAAWTGAETTGASAYDTSTVTTSDTIVATGSVTYTFYTNGVCSGTGVSQTVTLTGTGSVPNSALQGPLTAGSYSFRAVYSGDSNYNGSISPCEPFTVNKGTSNTATVVFDASTNAPWTGTETTGASAYDTSSVTTSDGFTATGTVVYTFFTNVACSGTGASAGTVTLTGSGAVPNSNTEGPPLAAGSYSFQATYSGDSNYSGSTSSCEPFNVNMGTSNTATIVYDASTNAPWSGTETTGASAYDTATVTTSDTIVATSTVQYDFFAGSSCTGTPAAQTVTLTGTGGVPNSATHGPLIAGSYSFQAVYSGDSNYSGSTSPCEPFTVGPGSSTTATIVFDATTNSPWTGTETTGASAYDTSTVTTSDGFTATGTVTYTFYTNGACSGTGVSQTVTLTSSGSVPNSATHGPLMAGGYSFQAVYSGDSNYNGSTSPCEPFTVNKGTSNTATIVFDAATNAAWSGTETTGASAYDTATVTTSDGFVATGTVVYTFYAGGTCSGAGVALPTVTLTASGMVPNSATVGPLQAGSYSFKAVYSGDSNYSGSTSPCEPFSVAKGSSITATVVYDATTNAPWTGTETTGSSAYDTASVTTSDGFVATGTVSYTFYTNGVCSGTGASAGTVTLTATGSVPNSNTEGPPMAAGSYSFQATYSGDSNYSGSTSPCEPFTVGPGSSYTATVVFDALTNAPWTGTETTGASAYDTASVTTSDGFVATGTVTYTFWTNGNCSGSDSMQTVTLTGSGSVPNSATHGPLAAGSYSFQAVYSGDSNYNGSTSSCEPFTVNIGSSATATAVFDASTNLPWTGTETTGASAYDTATVTTSDGFVATGTVSYTFFTNNACIGSGSSAGTVILSGSGSVPNSSTEGPLAAGSYSFQATYSGDSNYSGSTSACEPFTVNIGSSATATNVFDSATNASWSGTETTGASAYDTATVTTSDGFVATGTVSYTFFTNGVCSGTGASAGTVTLTATGTVPNSNTQGPLTSGSYAFQASYSGDSNYSGTTSPCEPFSVAKGSSTTATTVFDASTNSPWSGTESTGASAYDTASVTTSDGFVATGTVSYTFFTNGLCSGSGASAGTVTLTGIGAVPNSNTEGPPLAAGSYSFQATYSGDANYSGSTSGCEPFSVAKGTSNTATVVFDAATNAPWSGTETTGASAYDTSTVTTSDTIVATGTVTYTFWSNGSCSGGDSMQTVTLTGSGGVPNSMAHGPLTAGSYSFQAVYSGDSNYSGSTSPCEPFTVNKGSSNTATVVFDASTNAPWTGTETTGASAYDTATVTPSNGFTASGTVSYTFYTNSACNGSGSSAGTVILSGSGSVPNSSTEGPLAAGSYGFQATYSGDSNYSGSISPCEPFSVAKGSSSTSTTVFDASTNSPWSNTETVGASAYDTASVSASPFTPTGTVQYYFFSNAGCPGSPVPQMVTLTSSGSVPNSATHGPLMAGGYSFQAVYSGDSNYSGSTSSCEPFSVHPANSATSTTVTDQTTGMTIPPGTASLGDTVHDSANVMGVPSTPFPVTGTIQYQLSTNGCTGPFANFGSPVPVGTNSGPFGPLTAGSYAFRAVYSGDNNYNPSTSPCEPFTVTKNNTTITTTVFTSTGTSVAINGTIQAGTSVYDTATLTASPLTPTGTVTYTFYTNGACSGSGTTQTVTLTASGSVPNSSTHGPLNAGSYSFRAVYSGDSNYNGSTSSCEPFIVLKNNPTIATHVSPSTITVGNSTAVHDTAILSGGYNPTGSITFKVYFNSPTCSASSLVFTSSAVTVSGNGSYVSTPGFTPTMAGTYYWVASYSGDSNNNPFTSACGANGETLSVNMSQVTDTSFCPIPQNQFPLNLVTDPKMPSAFELVSTNPGQFYDNVFFVGPAGSPVTLTIGIPFPFVTQGAVPIQVSSSFGMVGNCFQPSFDATGQFSISATGGTLSSSGAPIIILGDYPAQQLGNYVYITVSGTVPSTGLVYVTVHMNYGLRQQDFIKTTTGTSSGTPAISCTTNPCATWTSNTAVILGSPQPYPFTVGGSLTTSYSVTSTNNFKKDPGFAGVVADANGKAIAGAAVRVYDSNGNLIAAGTTDANGVYLISFKYTGPSTTFTVKVFLPTGALYASQTVTMKSNQMAIADFGWV